LSRSGILENPRTSYRIALVDCLPLRTRASRACQPHSPCGHRGDIRWASEYDVDIGSLSTSKTYIECWTSSALTFAPICPHFSQRRPTCPRTRLVWSSSSTRRSSAMRYPQTWLQTTPEAKNSWQDGSVSAVLMRLEYSAERTTQGGKRTISVRSVFVCGIDNPPAEPPSTRVKAVSSASGGSHTLSVSFALRMTSFSAEFLVRHASTGEAFCKMEWGFPDYPSPNFTTRHILVPEGLDDVYFSGGLDWAIQIFHFFHPSQSAGSDIEEEAPSPPESCSHQQAQQTPSCIDHQDDTEAEIETDWSAFGLERAPSTPPELSETPLALSSLHLDNCRHPSVTTGLFRPFGGVTPDAHDYSNSDYGYENNDIANPPMSPMSLTTGTTRQSTPEWISDTPSDDNHTGQSIKDQEQIKLLSQRKQEAQRLYARNGDSSATLDVLNSAAKVNAAWFPSGFARF
jgi:hypothetical protein